MERQNERHRVKLRNEEFARILKLADMAHKKDPRVQAHEGKLLAAKQKKKEDKRNEIKKQKDDLERQAEEARLKKEEEQNEKLAQVADKKKKAEEDKKFMRTQRSGLRKAASGLPTPPPSYEVDTIIERYSALRLEELIKKIEEEKTSEAKLSVFKGTYKDIEREDAEKLRIEEEKERERMEEQKKAKAERMKTRR